MRKRCVCVCMRERERETDGDRVTGREGVGRLCVCGREGEGGRLSVCERQADRARERGMRKRCVCVGGRERQETERGV